MDKMKVRKAGAEMLAAMKPIAARYGFDVASHGGRIGFAESVLKFRLLDNSPKVQEDRGIALTRALNALGIKQNAFSFRGTTYKITDYNPSRPRYPITASRTPDGKLFKFSAILVRTAGNGS